MSPEVVDQSGTPVFAGGSDITEGKRLRKRLPVGANPDVQGSGMRVRRPVAGACHHGRL